MTKENQEQGQTAAAVAARWWADLLRTLAPPAADDRAKLGNPVAAMYADIMTRELQRREAKQLDAAKIQCFEDELRIRVETEIQERSYWGAIVKVDYDPDYNLQGSAKRAGIIPARYLFPIKTCMRIWSDSVAVREGYGAPWKTLWGRDRMGGE